MSEGGARYAKDKVAKRANKARLVAEHGVFVSNPLSLPAMGDPSKTNLEPSNIWASIKANLEWAQANYFSGGTLFDLNREVTTRDEQKT